MSHSDPMRDIRRSPSPRPPGTLSAVAVRAVSLLLVHAVVIGLLLAYLAWAEAERGVDANIGAGLGMLALAVWGLPWSLLVLAADLRQVAEDLAVSACATLNLVLHAAFWLARLRRLHRS